MIKKYITILLLFKSVSEGMRKTKVMGIFYYYLKMFLFDILLSSLSIPLSFYLTKKMGCS